MKKPEDVVEILEAYDLTGSFRAAAGLVGCDHKTVAYWVRQRDEAGGMPAVQRARPAMEAVFAEKIDELVDRSHGQIRADKAHGKLVAIGYQGSERTTRRWVAESKRRWRRKHGRRTRPWIPEPGLWMQWDYGDGPEVAGLATVLFCAWLAWSRFRVVVPLRDKTLPSVVLGLDRALRMFGACPTYALTDNEKTVSVDHVCGIAVRNPQIVDVARHYGLTIATCVPADPQSKGGSEATVRVAKADLVPTDHNLRPAYRSFAELEAACEAFMAEVNTRPHRSTLEPPVIRLAEEHEHLHRLPRLPHTLCFGETRKVNWQSLISVGGAQYSVPHELVDQRVWARSTGEELVVVHVDGHLGPREVARHTLTTPGRPSIQDEHYPPRPEGALERTPRARSAEERAFLALGPGAERWLVQAAAAGAQRVRRKIAEAVDLSKLHGSEEVEHALRACGEAGRFGDGDLAAILAHRRQQSGGELIPFPARSEDHSLQRSTRSWEELGR
ncbi:MAG TPA: IS21 family transposase [Solirubrobacteraceae bacterium]|nr:IS21 family transposase [Solirubrobacteraceae bacterium]